MNGFEWFLSFLAAWTLIEGSLILLAPGAMLAFVGRLFPKVRQTFGDLSPAHFRLYGAIEMGFGGLLGLYLLWAV